MINFFAKKLSERKQNKIRQAKLKGYGFGWAHYQLEHWPLEALEAWLTPVDDDYGPEITAWDAGLREAIHDIEQFTCYRRKILTGRESKPHWTDDLMHRAPRSFNEALAKEAMLREVTHRPDTRNMSSQSPLFTDELPSTSYGGELPSTSYRGTHGHTTTTDSGSSSSDSGSCN